MRFTAQTARDYAARAIAKRRENAILRENQPIQPKINPQSASVYDPLQPTLQTDLFSLSLSSACEEMLERVRKAKRPIEAAQLARALRDLRETWHLATGKPRPGLTRPDQQKPQRREIPRALNA